MRPRFAQLRNRVRSLLRAIVGRGRQEREMQEEMNLHLDRATERLMARGLDPAAARLAARREFGNVPVLQEESRDARRVQWVESVVGDLRFAFRHFARRPLTAGTMVLVLSIGIGVHSALFATIQAIVARPAPGVARDDALVRLRGREQHGRGSKWYSRAFSNPEVRDLAQRTDLFSSVAGWTSDDMVTMDVADPEQARSAGAQFVSGNLFATLGIRSVIGIALPPDSRVNDENPQLVVVLGHGLWLDAFGGSPDVVGRVIRLNDIPVRIVGVAPKGFNGPTPRPGSRTLLWLPLSARSTILGTTAHSLSNRDTTLFDAVARLRRGVTIDQANVAVRVLEARAVTLMAPKRDAGLRDADVVALRGNTNLPDENDLVLVGALSVGALLILLVACTNVSALAVGAAAARRHEIAVRLSLGASRVRVVRQLLTESCLLAVAGGLLGLVLYWWITLFVASHVPDLALAPDWTTFAFTMVFALGTGILFGLSPALHATRRDVSSVLKDAAGATRRSRLQSAFVVAQIAVTQPLLVGLAMLLALVIQDTSGSDIAVATHVIRVRFDALYRQSDSSIAHLQRVMQQVASTPGVISVVPDANGFSLEELTVHPDDRGDRPQAALSFRAHMEATSPGYFALLDVPILRGRELIASDTASGDPAIVIGDSMARQLWGSADPLGKRLRAARGGGSQTLVVVGVFDSRRATTRGADLRIYTPNAGRRPFTYLIRTAGPAEPLINSLRSVIRTAMPQVPIARIETLADVSRQNRRETLQVSGSAAAAGLLALFLASIGLYGVVSLSVVQRRREIGIRVALGARPQQVVAVLFGVGIALSAIGLILGLPLSVIVLNLLATAVGVPTANMLVLGTAIASVVVAVASLATWLPARRAATVDPLIALRAE